MEATQHIETEAVVVVAPTLLVGRHHYVKGDIVELPEARAKAEVESGKAAYNDRTSSVVSGPDRARRTIETTSLASPPRDASRFKGRAT